MRCRLAETVQLEIYRNQTLGFDVGGWVAFSSLEFVRNKIQRLEMLPRQHSVLSHWLVGDRDCERCRAEMPTTMEELRLPPAGDLWNNVSVVGDEIEVESEITL